MSDPLYIAVDLGAGSGRVFLAGFDPEEFHLEEIHRFRYPPYFDGQHLRWKFDLIFEEVMSGLRLAGTRSAELGRPVTSLGVDSWGVDYGLVDADGNLAADPVCYRDARTDRAMDRVFGTVPRDEIFDRTGIQFQKFNTIYQLFVENPEDLKSSTLLLIPDLLNYLLTGETVTEYTNATTTQLVNAATGDWDRGLVERLGLPQPIFQQIVPAGTRLGKLRREIAATTGLKEVDVVAPGTHDTASAVAAAPLDEASAFISSGTWSLIGVELNRPLLIPEVTRQNFTNEGGVYDSFRFLKNVMGLWIFESCRNEWVERGESVDYESLIAAAAAIDGFPGFVFPDDERFLNPESMLDAIRTQLAETGQAPTSDSSVITRIILDSLTMRYASVLRSIELLTDRKLGRIEILGGGGRNRYLNQMTANAARLPVRSGLTEATVVGNLLVQAIAAGRFSSLAEGRGYVASKIKLESFSPQPVPGLDEAEARYAVVESRFTSAAVSAGDGR